MNVLAFNIFTGILFGKDVGSLADLKRPYIKKDDTTEQLMLIDIFLNITKDVLEEFFHPISMLFPFAQQYNLIWTFRKNKLNIDTFKDGCREILKASKDQNSIANQLTHHVENLSDDVLFDDMMVLMVAGSETTSHSLVSALYFIQKYPKVHDSLVNELKENGFMDIENPNLFEEKYNLETLNDMPYLNSFVKETFRYDSVTAESFDNFAKEDIEICGVPIKKGQKILVDVLSQHFNEESWSDPLKFEPDRHDPDSEFSQQAKKQGITHDTYSMRSFGHGLRNCPGQTLAKLEMKIIIAFFVSHGQFKLDQKDIDNEGIGFGLGSHFNLTGQVTKLSQ
jgi:cytochrome P450